MLVTQQCFACPWKELSNCQIYLSSLATKYNRLGVDKRLWGNTVNPKWLFGIMLIRKIWEKRRERQHSEVWHLSSQVIVACVEVLLSKAQLDIWPVMGRGGLISLFALVACTAFTFLISLSFSCFMRFSTFVLFFSPSPRKRAWPRDWVDVWMLSGANIPEYHDQAEVMCSYYRHAKMQKCTPVNFRYEFNGLIIQQLNEDFNLFVFGLEIQFKHQIATLRIHISF